MTLTDVDIIEIMGGSGSIRLDASLRRVGPRFQDVS